MGNSLVVVRELQVLDSNTATTITPDLAIFNLQHHRAITETQITYEFTLIGMNRPGWIFTDMTEGPVSTIRFQLDQSRAGF